MPNVKRPNFLVIVADDLGYTDIGCYGSEIKTPNIDRIAREGCLFTDFHTSAACSPTRSMLMSGTDSHLAGVGVMSEMRGCEGERWNVRGHEGYLNHDVAALPEILQEAGYHTLLSGKWHLGLKPENNPAARGFDKSFALLPGCTNHWGFEPQFDDPFSFFDRIPVLYSEDGKRAVIEANTKNEYDTGFFSSEFYADNLIKYFKERNQAEKDKPFFAYLPFSAPHWPLQCDKADREKYKGRYDQGPDVLREERLAALRKLGLIGDIKAHPVIKEDGCGVLTEEWEDLTAEERQKSARSMECFAGMVDNMDQNIGKVLKYLDESGEADNTMVLFMSDNGAEGAAYESYPVMGKDLMAILGKYYDNSLDNIGNHDSFVWYGPRWAQAATAPSKLYKFYSTEGGIRVPMVCKFPPSWPKNETIGAFSTVMDLMPTLLDMAGIKHPVPTGKRTGMFQGREVFGVKGRSWSPFLNSRSTSLTDGSAPTTKLTSIYGEEEWVGWELFGRAALRKGKYKIVFMPADAFGKSDWELYDLSIDPGETDDLADAMPEKVEEMKKDWQAYVDDTGTVWGVPVSGAAQDWSAMPEDSVGGDPIGQTRAWMRIGQGKTPA